MKKKLAYLKFFGLITLIVYWSFTIIAILQNPWFSIMHNALSDLGGNKAINPWIYNYGLIISFPFLFLFSIYILDNGKNKLQIIGGSFIMISSIFLAFIGIFHSGTGPHGFVSTYFFLQFFFGMLVWGMGAEKKEKYLCISLFLAAFLGAFLPWHSTGLLEVYEILIIAIFTLWIPFHKN